MINTCSRVPINSSFPKAKFCTGRIILHGVVKMKSPGYRLGFPVIGIRTTSVQTGILFSCITYLCRPKNINHLTNRKELQIYASHSTNFSEEAKQSQKRYTFKSNKSKQIIMHFKKKLRIINANNFQVQKDTASKTYMTNIATGNLTFKKCSETSTL